MPSYVTPKKNTEFVFYIGLVSQADTKIFQSNPTLAAGDFKISTDGAALANLTTLPDVDPNSSKLVKVTLSASEMNGDNIQVIGSDAAGAEWCDIIINIQTTTRQVDDLAYPGYQVLDAAAADGSRPTIEQALYMICQYLMERSVSGTTMTVKKPDGSTTLMTFTLNSAVSPTSVTRAT